MKRLISILLALLLLTACGGKAASSSGSASDGGGLTVSQPSDGPDNSDEAPENPDEDASIPQADQELVREIVFTYGAKEDMVYGPGNYTTRNKSLFFREESWSGENGLEPFYYLYWEDSLPSTEEEWAVIQAGQHYAEEHQGESPFGYGYLGPGETVEEKILAHFEVTLEHLRGDPEYYDGSIPGYFMMAGGGMGERPVVSFTYEQEGDILTIPVRLTYSFEPNVTHTLTVRLEPDGGWKYLGCEVSSASSSAPAWTEGPLPPSVPHGEELDGLDFSAMDKEELIDLLQPVLDRAAFFCKFGFITDVQFFGIELDTSPEAAIRRPFDGGEATFYPCVSLPYRTVEELRQDMLTVFTPDILETQHLLGNLFSFMTDYDGRIYIVDGVSGFSQAHDWELEELEIVSAEKNKLTISVPVTSGHHMEAPIIAPLNFEVKDGYIVMDSSYFALKNP